MTEVAAYSEEWMESVCGAVWRARNLRQSITLAAALLTELLESEIEREGWDSAWKGNLAAFCAMMSEQSAETSDGWTDEDQETDEWAWSCAEEIMDLYGRLSGLSDWDLFADSCLSLDIGEEVTDKEEFVRWAYSLSVAYVHGYVTQNDSRAHP
ncbi:MAG: hypothetical protein IAE97_06850 [Chthoniobacterales bacterium]|nr:hypothetical protein [Chthoniobacterales bacterium]